MRSCLLLLLTATGCRPSGDSDTPVDSTNDDSGADTNSQDDTALSTPTVLSNTPLDGEPDVAAEVVALGPEGIGWLLQFCS